MVRVLFVMPNWNSPSEVFMYRQMEVLQAAGMLSGIVIASERISLKEWNGVPIYPIQASGRLSHLIWYALQRRLHLPAKNDIAKMTDVLRRVRSETVLFHYGDAAVYYAEALKRCPASIYVHIHGGDIQQRMVDEDYRETFMELARRHTIICNSQWSRDRLLSLGASQENLVVKYFGVETPPTPRNHAAKDEITILYLAL